MISATLCYIKKDGKTLMLHRIKKKNDIHEGKWNGLGGKFEPGESPEDCVRREVFEESGLSIKNTTYVGLLTFPNFYGNDWVVHVFTASDFNGELIDSPEGQLHWVKNEELLDLNLWSSDHYFLKWIGMKRFFSAKFEFDNEKVKRYDVSFY